MLSPTALSLSDSTYEKLMKERRTVGKCFVYLCETHAAICFFMFLYYANENANTKYPEHVCRKIYIQDYYHSMRDNIGKESNKPSLDKTFKNT